VLFELSVDIAPGEVVALMGRNGMGKSTLIRTIIGAVRPSAGSIHFQGRRIDGRPVHRVAALGIGLVPEGRHIFPSLTVEENLLATAANRAGGVPLLILDEATEGLAPLIREEIWRILASLKAAGLAILVVDKYVKALMRLADRHVLLEKGRIVWSGDSAALAANTTLVRRCVGV